MTEIGLVPCTGTDPGGPPDSATESDADQDNGWYDTSDMAIPGGRGVSD